MRDTRDEGDRREPDRIGYEPDMLQFPNRIYESRAEKQAVEMHESGKSLSQIATEIFGGKSGARVKQIKAWIEKHV